MRRKIGIGGLLLVVLVASVVPSASAAPNGAGRAASRSVDNCVTYLPFNLAISVPLPIPGQAVTITGVGVPGDTLALDLVMEGLAPYSLGTVLVPLSGNFSKATTIPAAAPPGLYTVRAKDPNCSQYALLNITVRYADQRCRAYKKVWVHRGWSVTWKLLGIWRTNKPVKVTLVPDGGGPATTIYNSTYPVNSRFTFTVPNALTNGWYFVRERGTFSSGVIGDADCARLKVLDNADTANDTFYLSVLAALLVSFSEPLSASQGSMPAAPQLAFILLIALVAAYTLRTLNFAKWKKPRRNQ